MTPMMPPRSALFACLSVLLLTILPGSISIPVQRARAALCGDDSFGGFEWRLAERLQPAELVHFCVAVQQSGRKELEDFVLTVSDPSSARYGQHMTCSEVQAMLAPSQEALRVILAWLSANNVSKSELRFSSNLDFIFALLPASRVESLIGVPLHRFQACTHDQDSSLAREHVETIVRPREAPKLPGPVAGVVDFVSPGLRFPPVRRKQDMKPEAFRKPLGGAPTPTQEGV